MKDLREIHGHEGSKTNHLINILGELRWALRNWNSHGETENPTWDC